MTIHTTDIELHAALRARLPAARVITDPLRRLAYGTDASFYRLVPRVVVIAESEDDVRAVLDVCDAVDTPLTFRAGGPACPARQSPTRCSLCSAKGSAGSTCATAEPRSASGLP